MKKILVIRLGSIGDVVLASAPVLNLKLSFPDSKIYFLTREQNAPLAEMISSVDEVVALPKKIGFWKLFQTGEYFDKMAIDMIVDLHGNFRSAYLSRHINSSKMVRYNKRRTERVKAVKLKQLESDPPQTIDLYNRAVLWAEGNVYSKRPILNLHTKRDSGNNANTIAIAPGASYSTKQWPLNKFEKLIGLLVDNNDVKLVLLLTKADQGLINSNVKLNKENFKIIIDAPLDKVAEYIAQSSLLICNDSGLMHIGSAVGTPVMAMFGPTHPVLGFYPRGLFDEIIQVDEPCRPCSLHGKKACYREEQFCFTQISAESVSEMALSKIESDIKGSPALFVDRDGTLIKEKNFLFNPDDVEPEMGSVEAVKMAKELGYKIIIVSNQSGVARGYFGVKDVEAVNARIREVFADNNAPVDDILYCPFHEDGSDPVYTQKSFLRKPAAGMVDLACRKHGINPFNSYCIGDKLSDVRLAYSTGGKGILVETGYGKKSKAELLPDDPFQPETITDNLLGAVEYIRQECHRIC